MSDTSYSVIADDYLKANPQIEKALEIFNLSQTQYEQAVKAQSVQPIVISTRSTSLPE